MRNQSGYANRPRDFDDLLRILDRELRLISPTDPEGLTGDEPANAGKLQGAQYYQLTHDDLVPALREWLTRKQTETRRGRAGLKLAERSTLWNSKPENRHLPSLWEWANIRALTSKGNWTAPQHELMARAGRVHGVRMALSMALLAVCSWAGFEAFGYYQAGRCLAGQICLVSGKRTGARPAGR